MKKSKLLQNSKDLLSRSFNPAKCKTSLRLAGSRLKLLRNKKEVQVKQMRREIAQLLESGQDRTARIRVEHVIREEKMMAAYDLLEIYCELIVARLPIIESQKNCPIDLKEAITSLVFAAPRCGDVPELLDVRKQFTAKYGKEFTTAAIELRPQCGVGRMLVEKLSAAAPDVQTKSKILSAIAEEHNVKWDPKSFEEKDSIPINDVLSGPSSFMKESEVYAEPPRSEPAQVQARPSNNMHSAPLNFSQQDGRTSLGPEKLAQTSSVGTSYQPEERLPGDRKAQEDSSYSHPEGRRWNMEFKDATSAAQAAAESAERASMAARAAAELSIHGRIRRQYSTESHNSDISILKDEGPEAHPNARYPEASVERSSSEYSRLQNERRDRIKPNAFKEDGSGVSQEYNQSASLKPKASPEDNSYPEASVEGSSSEYSRLQNERRDRIKPNAFKDDGSGVSQEYNQSASLKPKASPEDNSWDHGDTVVEEYSRKNTFKVVSEDEMSVEKHSLRYEAETENSSPEKAENPREGRMGKQHSVISSYSRSSISDDVNIFSNSEYQKFENDDGEDDHVVGTGKIGIHGEAPQSSFHEPAAVFFDKYDSDIDDHGFDKGGPTYDEQELDSHLSPIGQKSPEQLSINTDSWSPRSSSSKIVNSTSSLFFTREDSSPDLSENMVLRNDSELNSAPVAFDESDGPDSESDDDMHTRHNKVDDSRDLREQNDFRQSVASLFKHEEISVFDEKDLALSSDDELNSSTKMNWKRNPVDISDAESPKKLSLVEQSASGSKQSQMELNDIGDESRLNFGKLTGGLRHKGNNHLPFVKNRLDVSSSVKNEAKTTATITRSATPPPPVEKEEQSQSDSSEDEEPLHASSVRKHPISVVKEVKTNPSVGASNLYFGSDNSDLDEDSPKESPNTKKSHMRSGISQRTKASPTASNTNSHSKMRLKSEALDSDAGMARKTTTSSSSETPKESESRRRNSGKWETYGQPTSEGTASMPAKSKLWGPPEQQPGFAKATSVMKEESEAHDYDASPRRKPSKFYSPDSRQEIESKRNSSQLGNLEQLTPSKVPASKPTSSSLFEKPKSGKATIQESKNSKKSSAVEYESSSPQIKAEASIRGEDRSESTPDKASSSKDESNKKASHVHPKLPDYDTLFQSLRTKRT